MHKNQMRPIRPAALVQLDDAATRPGPPAEMIFNDWYPALRSAALKPGGTATTMLLGIPMLLGRKSDGTLFALRDLCPHPPLRRLVRRPDRPVQVPRLAL